MRGSYRCDRSSDQLLFFAVDKIVNAYVNNMPAQVHHNSLMQFVGDTCLMCCGDEDTNRLLTENCLNGLQVNHHNCKYCITIIIIYVCYCVAYVLCILYLFYCVCCIVYIIVLCSYALHNHR